MSKKFNEEDFKKSLEGKSVEELKKIEAEVIKECEKIDDEVAKTEFDMPSEKIDVIEEHYADTSRLDWLNRSTWGQAYMRLYNLYGNGGMTHYAVVQH